MSIFVQSDSITFFIPAERETDALHALREADIDAGDRTTVAAVMSAVGYEVETTPRGTALIYFSGLSRDDRESVALAALAPFVSDGSSVVWSHGDGDPWRQVVTGGRLVTQHVEWVDDASASSHPNEPEPFDWEYGIQYDKTPLTPDMASGSRPRTHVSWLAGLGAAQLAKENKVPLDASNHQVVRRLVGPTQPYSG